MELSKSFRFGLALSGGAARGIAHVGVIKALEEHGISLTCVSGTSMGAIVGLFYTAGFKPVDIQRLLREKKVYKVLGVNILKSGLFNFDGMLDIFTEHIKENSFASLQKPFFVAASNLNTGKPDIISEGNQLFEYVLASASIPFVFSPQQINGNTYIDGGLFNNLPSECLIGKVDRIIGVNVNRNGPVKEVDGTRAIAERTFNLVIDQNVRVSRSYCDYYIEPRELSGYSLWDYDKVDELVEIGYQAGVKMVKQFIIPELSSV